MEGPQAPEPPANGSAAAHDSLVPGSKRQRRPSVRLGDIGEQPAAITYEPYVRRSKQWKHSSSSAAAASGGTDEPPQKPRYLLPKDQPAPKPPSKSRPLTNIDTIENSSDFPPLPSSDQRAALVPIDENHEPLAAVLRRVSRDGRLRKSAARRIRSGWASKIDEGVESGDPKSSGGEDAGGDDEYREFDSMPQEGSESPAGRNDRRAPAAAVAPARVRASDSRDGGTIADVAEEDEPVGTDNGHWSDQNGRSRSPEDGEGGVQTWLNRMGLGRYAPVFEIHEVDEDVLPHLTLEDLKDMGINAVGSRRKMYCAIQRLQKGFK